MGDGGLDRLINNFGWAMVSSSLSKTGVVGSWLVFIRKRSNMILQRSMATNGPASK